MKKVFILSAILSASLAVAQNPVQQQGGQVLFTDQQVDSLLILMEQLDEVTVAAQRPVVKIDMEKLVYQIKDDPESRVSNTLDMLRKVPMVTVDSEGNVQLKGSSNFKIYMNGRPSGLLNSDPASVLKSLPASVIKNIEVITEPGARYDAEGVSGIINIVMERQLLDGYTASITTEATTMNSYGAGGFASIKMGKLGLTANYNFNYEKEPTETSTSTRENFFDDDNHLLIQRGEHYEKERTHRGYLEGSYEIDSLNLITVDANLFRKPQYDYTFTEAEMFNKQGDLVAAYNRLNENEPIFGSFEMNANYQHETKREGELLTFSYRFTNEPDDDVNRMYLTGLLNYEDSRLWDINKAKTNEHTLQLDYVLPMKGHELEMGAKYILRQTDSEITHQLYDEEAADWYQPDGSFVDFSHAQHIYSAYLGDAYQWKQVGLKAGVRAEGTHLVVVYANAPEKDFKNDRLDIVPNVLLSYSLNDANKFRLGYNMRIQRAGIDNLNPYIDESDPMNIAYGNPDLSSEKSHAINLNYSLFTPQFNMNASLGHTFVNNSIEEYSFLHPERPNVTVTTYGNIGKRNQTALFLYMNWNPSPLFRFYMNSSIGYVKLESEKNNLSNEGWAGRFTGGFQFTLPKDFRLHADIGYMMPRVELQGESSGYFSHEFSLMKDFFDKKLTVSIYADNPFMHYWNDKEKTYSQAFVLNQTERKLMREFGISLSFRIGNLSDSFKKIQRGIVNDDIKSGE